MAMVLPPARPGLLLSEPVLQWDTQSLSRCEWHVDGRGSKYLAPLMRKGKGELPPSERQQRLLPPPPAPR